MRKVVLFGVSLAVLTTMAEVYDTVTFNIKEGWNAIYMPVTPSGDAEAVFADWPVESVGFYDQAAFTRTKQFDTSADDTTLGAVENGMKMWFRGEPGKSTFSGLMANGIYIFNATADVVRAVTGVPAAMRVSWHVAVSTNAPVNFVGISTDGSEVDLTKDGYFMGLDTGWSYLRHLWGYDEVPTLDFFTKQPKKGNLEVVAMDAAKMSSWSGALFVSPADGINLDTNVCSGVLTVRNDAGTNRQVRVTLPAVALYLDATRHATWQEAKSAAVYERELAADETLTLRLAIDRTGIAGIEAGTEVGGIVTVTDVSTVRPTHFQTKVPFSVLADGGAFANSQWPKGLWVATLNFDNVSRIISKDKVETYTNVVEVTAKGETITNRVPVYATAPIPAGSTMTARVLVHVGRTGTLTLLQRARVNGRRYSSVILPADCTAVTNGVGTFAGSARFGWKVGEHSRVNPFRHARHPDHDGLDAYFKEDTPTGDEFGNYLGTVKPELFSIDNELTLDWNDSATAAVWSPEETLTGSCRWSLKGLRREGAITTTGEFTMHRISSAELDDILEPLNQ